MTASSRDVTLTSIASPTPSATESVDGVRPQNASKQVPVALVPVWLVRLVVWSATALISMGASALALAIVGVYRWPLALVPGVLLTVTICVAVEPTLRSESPLRPRHVHTTAVLAVAVAAISFGWNASLSAQHILHDRDPSVYVNTAGWLSRDGSLLYDVPLPFVDRPELIVASQGLTPAGGRDQLYFQFNHFVPSVLAVTHDVLGERAMFGFTALVGSLALLALYCMTTLVARRPWASLVAMTVVAGSVPFVAHVRDVYSEPYSMLFLWAALLVLALATMARTQRLGLLAGILISGCLLARIDGLLYVIGAALFLSLWTLQASSLHSVAVRRISIAFACGVVPGAALAAVDITLRSPDYAELLRTEIEAMLAALVVAFVALALLILARRSGRYRWPRPAGTPRTIIAVIGAASAAVALIVLWFSPPRVSRTEYEGIAGWINALYAPARPIAFPPGTVFAWRSLTWLGWYVGPITVALGIAGFGLLVGRTLFRPRPPEALLAVMFASAGMVYLIRPSIFPDQIWVMRRYLVFILPCLAVFAATTMSTLVGALPRAWRTVGAIAVSAAVLLPTALATVPVRALRDEPSYLDALRASCAVVGPEGAVLVVQRGYWDPTYLQALGAWCGLPAAGIPPDTSPDAIVRLAEDWHVLGRDVYLMTSVDGGLDSFVRAGVAGRVTRLAGAVNHRLLAHTFLGRPDDFWTQRIRWEIAPVAE